MHASLNPMLWLLCPLSVINIQASVVKMKDVSKKGVMKVGEVLVMINDAVGGKAII